jgi:hypothetical protein
MSSVCNTVLGLDPWLTYTNIPGTKDMNACEKITLRNSSDYILAQYGTPKIPVSQCTYMDNNEQNSSNPGHEETQQSKSMNTMTVRLSRLLV